MKVALLPVVGALGALVAYALEGRVGLMGALVGIGFGGLLAGAGHLLIQRARAASPRLLPATMLIGVATSFLLMAGFMFLVAALRREILVSSTLTALAVYLIYRFVEAFEVSQAVREGGCSPEGPKTVLPKGAGR